MNGPTYICLVKCQDKIYMLLGDTCIQGWKTEQDALDYWEAAYRRGHARGFEPSMSACLSFVLKQPSIILVNNIEEVKDLLVLDADGQPEAFNVGDVSGWFDGFFCNTKAEIAWDEGTKPTLIKDEWLEDYERRELEKRADALGMDLVPR